MVAKSKPNEIRITRFYDAPVKAVWNAWTDNEQVAQWWGPRGFTITTHSKDLKAGGAWHYTMHGPDGTDYPNKTKYLEVEPFTRLVYDHGGNDDRPPMFRVTVLFFEEQNKTRMEMTMALKTPEEAAEARKFVKKAGGNATWDRLAEYLSQKTSGKSLFVINRSFAGSIDKVFDMWARSELLAKWLPQTKFHYQELEKPHHIVYTQQFCSQDERVTKNPHDLNWLETSLNTVKFAEEEPGMVLVTVTIEVFGTDTPAELAYFEAERTGMTAEWTTSFDRLEECLESN